MRASVICAVVAFALVVSGEPIEYEERFNTDSRPNFDETVHEASSELGKDGVRSHLL